MERNEIAITGARVSAINTAREWTKDLVKLGATAQEIAEMIDEMANQAKAEAALCLGQKVT